jgi:hypothetical protein
MVVVLLLVAAAVLLWPSEEPAPIVEPEPPVAAAIPAAESSGPVSQEASIVQPDAGAPAPELAREVQFTLVRDGGALVGERITLYKNRETVGGTIDVMGFVTLPLTPGEWTVGHQANARTTPSKVLITPDTGLVTLTVVPRENLTGCVTTESSNPFDAEVHVRGASRTPRVVWKSGSCFSAEVEGDEADVWVGDSDYRSAVQHVALPAKVVLRAAKLQYVSVELRPESVIAGMISVSHRLGVTTGQCTPGCSVKIPSGEYEMLVAGVNNGQVLFARQSGTASSKDSYLIVNLTAAPPITGIVRTTAGVPLPNVPLRFVALDASSTDTSAVELARVLTRDDGSFIVQPSIRSAGSFPAWEIIAESPWKLSPAAVSLGDKPLELTAQLSAP